MQIRKTFIQIQQCFNDRDTSIIERLMKIIYINNINNIMRYNGKLDVALW